MCNLLRYRFFECERYQLLSERKNELPVFNGDTYEKHRNLELKVENAYLMFNNQLAPSLFHLGSLGVEACNVHIDNQVHQAGLKGVNQAYIDITLAKISWNLSKMKYLKKQTKVRLLWSQKIWDDWKIMDNNIRNLGHIMNDIKKFGLCNIDIKSVTLKLEHIVQNRIENHKLEIWRKPKWNPQCSLILFDFFTQQPQSFKLNEETIQQV